MGFVWWLKQMKIIFAFLLWTFWMYWIHRFVHSGKIRFLKKNHAAHHAINYFKENQKFDPLTLCFWFGNWRASLDVLVSMTLPLLIIVLLIGGNSWYLLLFHYFYEALLSEYILDHNKHIKGRLTKVFAWGEFHLKHHQNVKCNYGLLVCVWDYIFKTVK